MTTPMNFRSRLLNDELLLGTMLTLPSPEIAELMAMSGFDWLFMDMEHGLLDIVSCQRMIQATAGRSACIVRVAENSEKEIKKALDIGAHGIIVPKVNSAEEARAVVKYAKYAPQGQRGVGYSRAHGYGLNFSDYVTNANELTTVVVQIEDIKGVEQIDEIVKVPGIDAVFIGPYDLSASMGLMGQVNAPEVLAAMTKVAEAAKSAGISLGYFGLNPETVQDFVAKGYKLITCGTDTFFLTSGAKEVLTKLKK
jgi:2-dehydro-3-deoxyglucarate aldolase